MVSFCHVNGRKQTQELSRGLLLLKGTALYPDANKCTACLVRWSLSVRTDIQEKGGRLVIGILLKYKTKAKPVFYTVSSLAEMYGKQKQVVLSRNYRPSVECRLEEAINTHLETGPFQLTAAGCNQSGKMSPEYMLFRAATARWNKIDGKKH